MPPPMRLPSEEGKEVTQSALPGQAGVLGTVTTAAPGSRGSPSIVQVIHTNALAVAQNTRAVRPTRALGCSL